VKIPKRVKVGPFNYRIVFENQVVDNWDVVYGQTKQRELVIRLGRNCAVEQQEDTFVHEGLHAISLTFGIGLTEQQIAVLSPVLLAFLKDNRLLRE
jgi:hypothetical protein